MAIVTIMFGHGDSGRNFKRAKVSLVGGVDNSDGEVGIQFDRILTEPPILTPESVPSTGGSVGTDLDGSQDVDGQPWVFVDALSDLSGQYLTHDTGAGKSTCYVQYRNMPVPGAFIVSLTARG